MKTATLLYAIGLNVALVTLTGCSDLLNGGSDSTRYADNLKINVSGGGETIELRWERTGSVLDKMGHTFLVAVSEPDTNETGEALQTPLLSTNSDAPVSIVCERSYIEERVTYYDCNSEKTLLTDTLRVYNETLTSFYEKKDLTDKSGGLLLNLLVPDGAGSFVPGY